MASPPPVIQSPYLPAGRSVRKPKRSKFKVILVLTCLLLFLGGSTAGAFFLWYKFGDTVAALMGKKPTETAEAPAAGKPADEAKNPGTNGSQPAASQPRENRPAPPPRKPTSEEPLTYLPGGSNIFLGADLGSLSAQPALAAVLETALKKDKDFQIFQAIHKETGLDYLTISDQSVVGISADFATLAAGNPGNITVAYKSKTPFDPAKIAKALSDGTPPQQLHGMDYYAMKLVPPYVGFFMPNERILVLTSFSAEQLGILLRSDLTKPALDARTLAVIRRVEKSQLWLAMPFDDQQRQQLREQTENLEPNLPPELKPGLAAAQRVQSLLLWGGLENKKLNIHFGVDCADDKSAQDLTAGMEYLWDTFVKKGVELGPLKEIVAILPPYLEPTVKELTDGTKITRKDTFVQLSIGLTLEPLERFAKDLEKDPAALLQFTDPGAAQIARERTTLLKLINNLRDMEKTGVLKPNTKLDQAAQWYADKLAKQGKLDDLPDVQAVANKAQAEGYPFFMLNALAYAGTAETTFKTWTGFDAGKAIVIDKNWKDIGIAIARDERGLLFFVAVFAVSQ